MTKNITSYTSDAKFEYVVVQFYPWFKFSFLLFLSMLMCDNNMIMSWNKRKKIWTKDKIEPQQI